MIFSGDLTLPFAVESCSSVAMAVLVVGAITACTLVQSESSLTLAQARKSLQKRNVMAADEADWSRFDRRAVESRQG